MNPGGYRRVVFFALSITAFPAAWADAYGSERETEMHKLMERTGTWDVVATVRLGPGEAPVVTAGLIAERNMVGPYLEEVMKSASVSSAPDFRRICYLRYFQKEARWQYVSLDTRFPVGVLPAWSIGKERNGKLTLEFAKPGFSGLGDLIERRIIGSNLVIIRKDDDHDVAQQYWTKSGGAVRKWLAVEYAYTRKR